MYRNKLSTTRDNDNDKLKSTVIINSGVHSLINDKVIKNPFNENNAVIIKKR